jgi:hypothetical protein
MLALAIAVAAIAAFLLSSVYYALAPNLPTAQGTVRSTKPRLWQVLTELVRSALVAGLVAGLLVTAGWTGPIAGALLGLALATIPVVLLTGSVIWEGVPVKVGLLHLVDWLLKLPLIGLIVGLFI